MPPDVIGLGGAAGGAPVPPTAPLRPVEPSRSLVPVERAGSRPLPLPGSPLSRSGVALADLLFAADLVETREAVAPVAMEMGLESARGQLLRKLPGEALVALDAVWSGARSCEEGWYLRSGALTVMGHPGEGDRVASEGLESQPTSLALRLVQSVARAVVGDLSGARAALTPALTASPQHPVLLAQHAVLLARQGHADDAAVILSELHGMAPEHPALTWARGEVRSARADHTRGTARPAESFFTDEESDGILTDALWAHVDAEPADMVTGAFTRLGGRLATFRDDQLILEARMMLRACSAGGAMASTCMPEEAHAARQVLSALLTVVRQDAAAPSSLTPLMAQLLPLLRGHRPSMTVGQGVWALDRDRALRLDDAERVLRRSGASVTSSVRRLLEAMLAGAADIRRGSDAESTPLSELSGEYAVSVSEGRDAGPLIPVRLGLSLLADSAATRAFERSQRVEEGPRSVAALGHGATPPAAAIATLVAPSPAVAGATAALPAILLVAGAIVAVVNGAAGVAALLGGAAVFTALRRTPNQGD